MLSDLLSCKGGPGLLAPRKWCHAWSPRLAESRPARNRRNHAAARHQLTAGRPGPHSQCKRAGQRSYGDRTREPRPMPGLERAGSRASSLLLGLLGEAVSDGTHLWQSVFSWRRDLIYRPGSRTSAQTSDSMSAVCSSELVTRPGGRWKPRARPSLSSDWSAEGIYCRFPGSQQRSPTFLRSRS